MQFTVEKTKIRYREKEGELKTKEVGIIRDLPGEWQNRNLRVSDSEKVIIKQAESNNSLELPVDWVGETVRVDVQNVEEHEESEPLFTLDFDFPKELEKRTLIYYHLNKMMKKHNAVRRSASVLQVGSREGAEEIFNFLIRYTERVNLCKSQILKKAYY